MNFAIAITVAVMGCSSVLQGCGGGGDTATTTPAPTPTPAPSCDDKGLEVCKSQYAADKEADKCKASKDYEACNNKHIKTCTVDKKAAKALEEAQLVIEDCETAAARKAVEDAATDKAEADKSAKAKIIADEVAALAKAAGNKDVADKAAAAAATAKAAADKAATDLKAAEEAAKLAGGCPALEQCTSSFQAAIIQAGPGTKPCAAMEDYVGCITPGLEACTNPTITAEFGTLKDQMATTVALQCAQAWKCSACGNVYDPMTQSPWAPDMMRPMAFDELPDSWTCPKCGQPKSAYKQVVSPGPATAPGAMANKQVSTTTSDDPQVSTTTSAAPKAAEVVV